ncbi:MAG: class I SAM-dependent methyltransferase [Mariprofundaceae bacterium]|nr:class I SAM-dependent methyltransferase [Mariprofundaceae bacterium]
MRQALNQQTLKDVYRRLAGRYDTQHAFLTAHSDQRGRALVVEYAVRTGEKVLDCGAGTGSTGLLAAEKVGKDGRVTLFDLCDGMLEQARKKSGVSDRIEFQVGDMHHLPFADGAFDVALSTYSLCPLYDPVRAALEMYRVIRPGGRIGIAHSTGPESLWVKWPAEKVEDLAWKFPSLSMGCRPVSVLPALERAGARVIFKKRIGVPLWPFLVVVMEKPAS